MTITDETLTYAPPPLEHWQEQANVDAEWTRGRLLAGDSNSLQFLRFRPPGELREVFDAAVRLAGLDTLTPDEIETVRDRLAQQLGVAEQSRDEEEQAQVTAAIRYADVAIVMRDALRLAGKGGRYAPAQGGWVAVDLPIPEVSAPENTPTKEDVTKGKAEDLKGALGRVYDRHAPDTTSSEALRRGKAICPTCITIDPHSRVPEQSLAPCATLLDLLPR